MGERVVEREKRIPKPLIITDGSDTKPFDSLLPSALEEGSFWPENGLMSKHV